MNTSRQNHAARSRSRVLHHCKHLELRSIFLQKESPDRYAAAICIAIRPDCYADILKAEAATCPCCEGAAGFRRYPDAMKFSSNGYFFFFLAVFFAFFAFFAFLAMLPSVIPKLI
jgi:hypothetical protein